MLTRLTDRVEKGPDDQNIKIRRWGLWGTMSEIEKRGKKQYVIVTRGKVKAEFESLEEAELKLRELSYKKG